MDKIKELDIVVLRHRLAEHGLDKGDVGTVIHAYRDGAALIRDRCRATYCLRRGAPLIIADTNLLVYLCLP